MCWVTKKDQRSTEGSEIPGKCSYIHEEMPNRCLFVLSGERIQKGSGNRFRKIERWNGEFENEVQVLW